jgi:low affinity Fe/Cu permease
MGKGSIDPDSPAALAKSAIGREERRSLIAVDPDRALRIGGCHGKRHSALADRHSNSDHHPVAAVPGLTTADGRQMNKWLFQASEFLSAPLGFYALLLAMAACTALVPLGWTDVVTYALSVLAIVITGIVLIQGYRDTTALHAKMDELIIALRETRNDLVGLEHRDPKEIASVVEDLEIEAAESDNGFAGPAAPSAPLVKRLLA